jgi:uncharacterized repeat protein (TIGR01451 family)
VRGATADMSITKTNGVTSLLAGQPVTYTIVVTNNGPDAVNGVRMTDTMPARLTGVTWTCTSVVATNCTTASGSGNAISATVSLGVGESATFTVNATVAAGAPGTVANTATVAAPAGTTDPVAGNNSATDSDPVLTPVDLSITVTDGQTLVNRGTQIRYTIVATNNGPNAVTGARIQDTFPNLLDTVNWVCTTTGGATCGGANNNGTINRLVNMPVGSTVTFTTTSGRVPPDTNQRSFADTATIVVPTGFQDTNPANNSATDTDTINGRHLGAMTGSAANTSATQWSAAVTITVHDATHNPLAGVTVNGGWVAQGAGSGNCTTNALGQCTVTRTGISRTAALGSLAIYAVTNLNQVGPNAYQPLANDVPAAITVLRSSAVGIAPLRPAAIGGQNVTGRGLIITGLNGGVRKQ